MLIRRKLLCTEFERQKMLRIFRNRNASGMIQMRSCKSNEKLTGVRGQVLRSYHHYEPDGSVVVEHLVRPSSDGSHTFYGSDTIVGNQDFVDDMGSPEKTDELFGRRDNEILCRALRFGFLIEVNARHGLPVETSEAGQG